MFKEAVEIEKEFIIDSIPCKLIGMNAELMSEYIEFVAERLLIQLGYTKIWNAKNPFDFMELISLRTKANFFERRVGEYKKANVGNKLEDLTELDEGALNLANIAFRRLSGIFFLRRCIVYI